MITVIGDERRKRRHPVGATSAPILRLSAVNITNGTMAKGSCRLKTTLAEDQQLGRALGAVPDGDDGRRHDGDGAGEQPPEIGRQANVEEALHHDLTRKRRRDRRVEPASEQRQREQRRRQAPSRAAAPGTYSTSPSSATSVCPVRWKVEAARIRIEALMSEREHQRDGRIDGGELDRLALLRHASAEAARLHDARMQIEIMRHHRGAENAEREIEHLRDSSRSRPSARSRGSPGPNRDRPWRSGCRSRRR